MADEMVLKKTDPVSGARDDAALIASARDGEQEAFGELVTRHQDRVYSVALRLTGDSDEAADLAQEAFLKAWRGIRGFRGGSSFYTWLFRITVNEARSRMRYRAVRPSTARLEEDAGAAREEGPLDRAGRMERKEIVEKALARMHPEQRMIVLLRDLEGRDYAEIAELLECPAGTVKSRLHRARMALKELLAPMLGSGEDG